MRWQSALASVSSPSIGEPTWSSSAATLFTGGDRWGIGRTQVPKSKTARGIPEWASAVEEILDLLHIDQCSVMAHSAGAPYALSFANKVPERVRGEILLLAPWVGGVEGGSYFISLNCLILCLNTFAQPVTNGSSMSQLVF